MDRNVNGQHEPPPEEAEEGITTTIRVGDREPIVLSERQMNGMAAEVRKLGCGGREKQRSFFQEYPDLDEHVGLAERRAREMVEQLTDELGMAAATSSSMKMATQYYTPRGVLMDQVVTIKVDIKPAKPEEE
jgi:hypothetical protein